MTVTNFIWDVLSDNVLCETDENDVVTARYTNRPEQFGELISQERNGTESFYFFDGVHSTSALIDENENVTDTFGYSAFGEEVSRTGTTENPFGYKGSVGYYTNSDTNDVYVRARTYQPVLGRWLSKDPLGFIDGSSLYRGYFVPNGIDPSGMECKVCKSHVSYCDSIAGLDAFVTKPVYSRYASLTHADRTIPTYGIFPNVPKNAGPYIDGNNKGMPHPDLDANALMRAFYLFYVSFAISEDIPGDCQMFVNELGSEVSVNGGPFEPDKDAEDHGFMSRNSGDNVKVGLREDWGCCDQIFMFADAPMVNAVFDNYPKEQHSHKTLRVHQIIQIKDVRSNDVVSEVEHWVTIGIDGNQKLVAIPGCKP